MFWSNPWYFGSPLKSSTPAYGPVHGKMFFAPSEDVAKDILHSGQKLYGPYKSLVVGARERRKALGIATRVPEKSVRASRRGKAKPETLPAIEPEAPAPAEESPGYQVPALAGLNPPRRSRKDRLDFYARSAMAAYPYTYYSPTSAAEYALRGGAPEHKPSLSEVVERIRGIEMRGEEVQRNPELLIVTNPGCARPQSEFNPRSFRIVRSRRGAGVMLGCSNGQYGSGSGRCRVGTRAHAVFHKRGCLGGKVPMKRRKYRGLRGRRRLAANLPLTIKRGGRKHTWMALVRKHGVMGAKKIWRRAKKYHGYTRTRVSRNPRKRRRSRARNDWRKQPRRHRRAAKLGWRRRRTRKSKRTYTKRNGHRKIKYRRKLYTVAALRRKIGKTRTAKLLRRRGRTARSFRRKRSRK